MSKKITPTGLVGTLYSVAVAHTNNIGFDGKPFDKRPHTENPDDCWCWKEDKRKFKED